MRLKSDINIMDFLKNIKKCQGDVYFETPEGDSLVLSSALSQYIFCSIIDQPDLLGKGTIRFADAADRELLLPYLCE